MMSSHLWVFRARAVNVVDGDTIDVVIDAGFRATRVERLRLLGLNTPERKTPTRAAGDAARAFAMAWLDLAASDGDEWPLVVQTEKSDAFGRYLATIWDRATGRCLNDDLIASGNAVPFMT
jgi:micrococcal nuclease